MAGGTERGGCQGVMGEDREGGGRRGSLISEEAFQGMYVRGRGKETWGNERGGKTAVWFRRVVVFGR